MGSRASPARFRRRAQSKARDPVWVWRGFPGEERCPHLEAPPPELARDRTPSATPDPNNNAWDAILTAARCLCAGAYQTDDVRAAVLVYNPSESHADNVFQSDGVRPRRSIDGEHTLRDGWHRRRCGSPPSSPNSDSPTSGAVKSRASASTAAASSNRAYAQAGVTLPRTTFGQIDVGVPVAVDQLRPCDRQLNRRDGPRRHLCRRRLSHRRPPRRRRRQRALRSSPRRFQAARRIVGM